MIISETLFSMDGDLADLNGLRYLSKNMLAYFILMKLIRLVYTVKMGMGLPQMEIKIQMKLL